MKSCSFLLRRKKIFHLLPVRAAKSSNKAMAVSLTSSCSCGDEWVFLTGYSLLAPFWYPPHLATLQVAEGSLEPTHWCVRTTASVLSKAPSLRLSFG